MTMTEEATGASLELETPFAESAPQSESGEAVAAPLGLLPWTESASPFAETIGGELERDGEQNELIAEAFENLRDEQFDEALAELISETAEAADTRISGEQPMQLAAERQQLADNHLAPIGFEAEQCVQRFAAELENLDLEGLAPDQLDEVLERFDPRISGVSPAGEQFIGGLIRKAKNVVKSVVKVAGNIAKGALSVFGPILNKLKALIRPLLRRVLAIAINKLPAALHEPARMLAKRFGLGEAELESTFELEAEEELLAEGFAASPVTAVDPETLAESFDAALAESVLGGEALEQGESFGHDQERGSEPEAGTQLEALAEARSAFIGQLQAAAEGEDLTPAMEQFIPAILPALRLGIRLVGRHKVVNFLAGFLAKLIGKWVGPKLSGPLSNAIVDIGLRIVGLEQGQPGELEQEAAPAMLAATVEDTVRRLSELPEHLFEDEDLMQVAVTEAFEQAVAANFPAQFVRPDLQIAPSIGGSFVTRHARQPFAYKRFSRVPEIEVSAAMASSIRTFRGVTLDAALRAAGIALPARFRVHVFESGVGTTLPRIARLERIGGAASPHGAYSQLHPLTVANAGLLLREPKLGVDVPGRFLESRHRISVGQRFFYLEPIGQAALAMATPAHGASMCDATRPSDGRMRIRLRRGEVVLTLYFSEADAQKLASAVSGPNGSKVLLRAVVRAALAATGSIGRTDGAVKVARELEFELEAEDELGGRGGRTRRLPIRLQARLRAQVRASAARALAEWARTRGHEFVRAAQDPACGVTIRIHVRGLVGLAAVAQPGSTMGTRPSSSATTTVTVSPGRRRP